MVTNEEIKDKLTNANIDFFLKEKLVELWFKAVNLSIDSRWKECFYAYKSMFRMIEGYNFSSKGLLGDITRTLGEYIEGLGNKPLSSIQILEINKKSIAFKEVLDLYMSELPKAFIELDLWFRSMPSANNVDLRFSDENFNSEKTIVSMKKDELKTLDSKKLVSLMSNNVVHDIYARWRVENVL